MFGFLKRFGDAAALRRRIAELEKAAPDSSPMGVMANAVGGQIVRPQVGAAVDQLAALRGWVFAAVRLIGQRIAGQQICVARVKSLRSRKSKNYDPRKLEPLEDHPLLSVMHDPNELFTKWALMFVTIASLECTGRAIWWRTNDNGRDSIFHIPTPWLREVDPKRTTWTIRPDGAPKDFTIDGSEICYFFYPDPANPLGALSPLQRIADAVTADEEIGRAQWAAFRNGIFPKVVLKAGRLPDMNGRPGERPILTGEQRNDLISAIRQVYSGTLAYDRPFILDGLIEEITKISNTVAEMDFLDSSKLTKSKILQAFGVSPILLGEVEGANRASATVADEIFVANKVNPLISLMSQTMTEWLGPMYAGKNERLVVWIEPAAAHDAELLLKQWEVAARLGFVSQNEFRRNILNLEDVDGGDEYLTPAMMLPRAGGATG